jgi:hypothetical protein
MVPADAPWVEARVFHVNRQSASTSAVTAAMRMAVQMVFFEFNFLLSSVFLPSLICYKIF